MRLTLAAISLAILLDACRIDAPPPPPAPPLAEGGPAPTATPEGTSGGHFFCRNDRGELRGLALRKLAVSLTTKPGTVRTHLTMEVAGPPRERVEAVMRLAVPQGAAVTGAVLWVNGRPMNGAFVQRDRARQIYRSIVDRRRDPALVTWDGPGWVSVSIFPLERGEPRRFELEWIEPAATEGGVVQYHLPTIVNDGRVLGRPSVESRRTRAGDPGPRCRRPGPARQRASLRLSRRGRPEIRFIICWLEPRPPRAPPTW